MSDEYAITPKVISRCLFLKIWQDLVEIFEELPSLSFFTCDEVGTAFTTRRFMLFLCRCAALGKFPDSLVTLKDRTQMLLERMELSPGFNKIQMKTHKPFSSKMTFISSQRMEDILSTFNAEDQLSKTQPIKITPIKKSVEKRKLLEKLYQDYSQNESLDLVGLILGKFVKLIEDLGVMNSDKGTYLKKEDIELIYTMVTRRKPRVETPKSFSMSLNFAENSKMTFDQFLIAIEIIAAKHFLEMAPDDAFDSFIEYYVENYNTQNQTNRVDNEYINRLLKSLYETDLAEIFKV